jgi:hypothetical protein
LIASSVKNWRSSIKSSLTISKQPGRVVARGDAGSYPTSHQVSNSMRCMDLQLQLDSL